MYSMNKYGLDELKMQSKGAQLEFYVSSSSKDLMRKIGEIMKRDGYIGYADGSGKMHFIIDGANNLYSASNNIYSILAEVESTPYAAEHSKLIDIQEESIEAILRKFKIPENLKGYAYLRSLLFEMLSDGLKSNLPDKETYNKVAEYYETGRKQIDRVINYSFKKGGWNAPNSHIITSMLVDLRKEYKMRMSSKC